MQPGLMEGDRVVVSHWAYFFCQPKVGDVIVFRGNDDKTYVKRVTAEATDKKGFFVEGDNKDDSKELPPVSRKVIIGKVVARYS